MALDPVLLFPPIEMSETSTLDLDPHNSKEPNGGLRSESFLWQIMNTSYEVLFKNMNNLKVSEMS